MRTSLSISLAAGLALAAAAASGAGANASTMVIGGGQAHDCAVAAIAGSFSDGALELCSLAIDTETLGRLDRARTYVNRGVIYLRRSNYTSAARDFNMAQKIAPALPEVFVNRGALYLRQERYKDAIAETDHGLALNPEEPAKAYFNRALARELSNDLQGAYMDFRKAAELSPDWPAPKMQMSRFIVKSAAD